MVELLRVQGDRSTKLVVTYANGARADVHVPLLHW